MFYCKDDTTLYKITNSVRGCTPTVGFPSLWPRWWQSSLNGGGMRNIKQMCSHNSILGYVTSDRILQLWPWWTQDISFQVDLLSRLFGRTTNEESFNWKWSAPSVKSSFQMHSANKNVRLSIWQAFKLDLGLMPFLLSICHEVQFSCDSDVA